MNFTSEQITRLKTYISKLKLSWTSYFCFYLIPFRKKTVLANLHHVFGNVLTSDEIKTLAIAFYGHVAKSLKETLLLRLLSIQALKEKVEIKGQEYMLQLQSEPKGAILITGHFGSWEFAPIAGMLHFPEYRGRFYFVRKLISAKWIETILFRRYNEAGLKVIPKKNSLTKVCDILEESNAVVFVMDQHASLNNRDGILVNFFGSPAATYRSPAVIAKYMQVPVLPVRSYRSRNGKHVLEFLPKLPWITAANQEDEIKLNTEQFNHVLEQCILDYPEQWMWMHKRWKRDW